MTRRIGTNLVDDPTQNNFMCSCGEEDWAVIETRKNGIGIRRRRECMSCHRKVTSLEVLLGNGDSVLEILSMLKQTRSELKQMREKCSTLLEQLDFLMEE